MRWRCGSARSAFGAIPTARSVAHIRPSRHSSTTRRSADSTPRRWRPAPPNASPRPRRAPVWRHSADPALDVPRRLDRESPSDAPHDSTLPWIGVPHGRDASRLEHLGSRLPREPAAATAACVLFTIIHAGLDRCNRLVYYFHVKEDVYGRAGHSRHGTERQDDDEGGLGGRGHPTHPGAGLPPDGYPGRVAGGRGAQGLLLLLFPEQRG